MYTSAFNKHHRLHMLDKLTSLAHKQKMNDVTVFFLQNKPTLAENSQMNYGYGVENYCWANTTIP